MTRLNSTVAALTFLISSAAGVISAQQAKTPEPVHIGMVSSLFNDVPPAFVQLAGGPFRALVKEFTGLDGQLLVGGDTFDVAKKLMDKKLDLAVFHGFEFGWAVQKYPELRPLTIAVSKHRQVYAYLIVRDDSTASCFADLKGKDLGFPRKSKEHSRVFMERCCTDCAQCTAKSFFGQVVVSNNIDDALDDILRGKLQGVVTDTMALEEYEQFKPGCFARLKIIKISEPFPPAVIVYRDGALDAGTLRRFRDGMISANQSPRGRDMMNIFKMTGFEPVPANYSQMIADVIRQYPAPAPAEKVSQQ